MEIEILDVFFNINISTYTDKSTFDRLLLLFFFALLPTEALFIIPLTGTGGNEKEYSEMYQ